MSLDNCNDFFWWSHGIVFESLYLDFELFISKSSLFKLRTTALLVTAA